MTAKFRMKQKVKIISSQKTDGRFNYGRVVGIEIKQNAFCLGYSNKTEFFKRFDGASIEYTIAYIDCVTNRACVEKFMDKELNNDSE